jgi:alpha-methylacyl-CoA racemase
VSAPLNPNKTSALAIASFMHLDALFGLPDNGKTISQKCKEITGSHARNPKGRQTKEVFLDSNNAFSARTGPLAGLRVIEFAGIGPGPFACMLLSDMGADVVRIDRKGAGARSPDDIPSRGRRVIELNLQDPADAATAMELACRAEVLVEGFRPGVMERVGLGPDAVLSRNPKIVYGRLTGWGQTGPLAPTAGHDINYIALSGALNAIGTAKTPVPPLNLVGDYAGGSLYMVVGILAAVLEARRSGLGQIVDAAIIDGAASMMALFCGKLHNGQWHDAREANVLDGGSHYYGVYETLDGQHLAVGAIEPKFFAILCDRLGISPAEVPQEERARWPAQRERIALEIRKKTRDEWTALFAGTDACVAPVLSLAEASAHPHNAARDVFVDQQGIVQPAPAPRFSRTPSAIQGPPPNGLDSIDAILASWA